jgi:hypothetical protein
VVQVIEKKIHIGHSTIELRKDGIVEIHFLENTDYGLEEVEELISAYDQILENKKYPLLHIPQNFVSFSKETREFSVTDRGSQYSKAETYVIINLAYKIMSNLYLKVNRPPVPTKFFKTMREAEDWLLTFN